MLLKKAQNNFDINTIKKKAKYKYSKKTQNIQTERQSA